MNEHRYILEPYQGIKSRYNCPNCQRKGEFVRYIDTETGKHLHPSVGRCNRENKCGYHYTPKQYFQDNNFSPPRQHTTCSPNPKILTLPQKTISYIPVKVFKASLKNYQDNNFVTYLVSLFGAEVTSQLISRNFLATSQHWPGANVFWQIDIQGKIRTGKIMLYNPSTGKRSKEPFNHITWVHSAFKQPDFSLKQCLFGEHQLRNNTQSVALVESEKTAVIASVYLPQFLWLAVGGKGNLTAKKLQVLKGRNVALFPDLTAYEAWYNFTKKNSHLAKFTVSDLLERNASDADRRQGFDIADYLVRLDYRKFVQPVTESEPIPPPTPQPVNPLVKHVSIEKNYQKAKTEGQKLESWEREINQLLTFFEKTLLPSQPVKLNPWETITDLSKFIDNHFETVKANNGKRTFLPYLNRLHELKQVLTTSSN